MRFITVVLLLVYGAPGAEMFEPPDRAKVEWNATNELPRGLWIYKVVPRNFPPAVVSNALQMAGLRMSDLRNVSSDPMVPAEKHLAFFSDAEDTSKPGRRWLALYPTLGYMDLYVPGTAHDVVEDVPDEAEAERLALDCLFRLGVDHSLIAPAPRGITATTWTRTDKKSGKDITTISSRHVYLIRWIDGVLMNGNGSIGGFVAEFGSHGAIKRCYLTWRNLVPHESHRTLTAEEIMNAIRGGQTWFPGPHRDMGGIKKLNVVNLKLYYGGASGLEKQDLVSPFGELEMRVETDTNNFRLYVHCPILATNSTNAAAKREPEHNVLRPIIEGDPVPDTATNQTKAKP